MQDVAAVVSETRAIPACAAGAPKFQKTTGRFPGRLEAAVARDLSVVWRQLLLGCEPTAASESFNCPLARCGGRVLCFL